MNATTASSFSLNPIAAPTPIRPRRLRRLWTHSSSMAQIASTAAIMLLTVLASLGIFRAFNPSGGGGDGEGFYGAVPIATVPEDAVTSSIPYPTADECTATPRTREEVAAILRTPPDTDLTFQTGGGATPDRATAEKVLALFRQFAACSQKGYYHMLSADLVTEDNVFYLVYRGPYFGSMPAAESDEEIDLTLKAREAQWSAWQMTTPVASPVPEDDISATTVVTLFPEDLELYESSSLEVTGPRQIRGKAYSVDQETREVLIQPPFTVVFYEIDGRWLIAGVWLPRQPWE